MLNPGQPVYTPTATQMQQAGNPQNYVNPNMVNPNVFNPAVQPQPVIMQNPQLQPTQLQPTTMLNPGQPVYTPTATQMQQAGNPQNYVNPNMVNPNVFNPAVQPPAEEEEAEEEALEEIAEIVEEEVEDAIDEIELAGQEKLKELEDEEQVVEATEETLLEEEEELAELLELEKEKVQNLEVMEDQLEAELGTKTDELEILAEGAAEVIELAAMAEMDIEQEEEDMVVMEAELDEAQCPKEQPTTGSLCEEEAGALHGLKCPYDECTDACGQVRHKTLMTCKVQPTLENPDPEWRWAHRDVTACYKSAEVLGCAIEAPVWEAPVWEDEEEGEDCECPDGYTGRRDWMKECNCGVLAGEQSHGTSVFDPNPPSKTSRDDFYHQLIHGDSSTKPRPTSHKANRVKKQPAQSEDKGGVDGGFWVLFLGSMAVVLGLGYCCYAKSKPKTYGKLEDPGTGQTNGQFKSLETPKEGETTNIVLQGCPPDQPFAPESIDEH